MTPAAVVTRLNVATDRLNAGQITLVVGACPFCGKTHRHGGGTDLAGIRGALGTRVSHCHRGEYDLVLAETLKETTP